MHAHEFKIDETLVKKLISEQFSQWQNLPIIRVNSVGTDNVMYKLGATMVLRFPRLDSC
jgi:aminoglycoside phosphotransferase (APT) family kinase protein